MTDRTTRLDVIARWLQREGEEFLYAPEEAAGSAAWYATFQAPEPLTLEEARAIATGTVSAYLTEQAARKAAFIAHVLRETDTAR